MNHDLSATALGSNKCGVQGTPLHVLQELGGWECVEMVRKYAHLSSEHLAEYVDRMSGLKLVKDGDAVTISLRSH